MTENIKIISKNRKARHDYHLDESFEAGMALMGSEIKSIRANQINLRDGFVQERYGELWLMNVHIATYDQGGIYGHSDPMRPRKLLLHKREIIKIVERIRERGYTVIPTMIYLKRGRAKVEIAVARGKREFDKRQDIAKRDAERQMRRAIKEDF
jgi:SsrA-binding protein